MATQGWGRIINLSSVVAQMAGPGDATYVAAKGGLESLTRALAAEYGKQGITVNAICPGFFATEPNKRRARKFIGSVLDAGATEHEDALKLAIRYQPDVIFFLTDAAVPRLDANQLSTIRRRASGITINAIEFGRGPKQEGDNFLNRLAGQNGGQYSYHDIIKLVPVRGR